MIITAVAHGNRVAFKAACGGEVEDKEQSATFKGDDMVILMDPLEIGIDLVKDMVLFGGVHHVLVKFVQGGVLQIRVEEKTPLPAAVLEAVSVAGTGEVNPFRMAEFIPMKVR